jgi:hypothetical protein
MNKLRIILAAILCSLALAASAEDTNNLKTAMGVFDVQTGVIIVKGYSLVGSLSVGTDEITVIAKESTEVGSSRKADGLAILMNGNQLVLRDRILIDYDEIDPLLDSINYLNKIAYGVTPLPSFEADYSTRAGLRVIADQPRKDGGVKLYLAFGDHPRILLSQVQFMQFYALVGEGKNNLDSLKSPK